MDATFMCRCVCISKEKKESAAGKDDIPRNKALEEEHEKESADRSD